MSDKVDLYNEFDRQGDGEPYEPAQREVAGVDESGLVKLIDRLEDIANGEPEKDIYEVGLLRNGIVAAYRNKRQYQPAQREVAAAEGREGGLVDIYRKRAEVNAGIAADAMNTLREARKLAAALPGEATSTAYFDEQAKADYRALRRLLTTPPTEGGSGATGEGGG